MENAKILSRNFSTIGEGVLLIWWGLVIMVNPITIGMGAIGTGLIMLGVNAARTLNHIPTIRTTTWVGSIAIVWGTLDTLLNPDLAISFAILLIIIGAATIIALLANPHAED